MNIYSTPSHYKEQTIQTMTSKELLGVVLDELVRRLYLARHSLQQKEYELVAQSLERSIEIYHYLRMTLNRSIPRSAELYELYQVQVQFLYRILASRSCLQMEEAVTMARELRDTFCEAEKASRTPSSGMTHSPEWRVL